jgi:hypothetical protein
VDATDVTREIRRAVWPFLREQGFDSFTGRTAWRHVGTAADDIWFVLPDGANLVEVVDDALRAIRAEGLAWLQNTRNAANAAGSAAGA